MRAMTVRVNDVIGVAGFTQAGHRVDVVVILSGNEAAARTVLSNIQVLSADRRIDQEQARAGTGADQRVVTLLVSPEDGEKLALATTQGQIVLALRNPLDVVLTETKGVRVSSLMSGAGAAAPAAPRASRPRATAPPPPPPAPAGPKVVQAIRGPKVTQEVIKCCQ
jgi:pilus assembly protein CpaB